MGAVYGHGWLYYVTIGSVLAVLSLSANTSFVDFPWLCHLVAEDGFLPRPFAIPGRRLVYSVGILFLAAGTAGLVAAFGGITDRLIPLFAVGAFLSFTLSQAGMAAHWWHALKGSSATPDKAPGARSNGIDRAKLAINGIGAVATGITLAVIVVAKFPEGAWLTVLVVPCTIVVLHAIRRYYDEIDRQVLRDSHRQIELEHTRSPIVLVPIKRWDRLSRKAMEYALRVSSDVTALHVAALEGPDAQDHQQRLRSQWQDCVEEPARRLGLRFPGLDFVKSDFRSMTASLLRTINKVQCETPDRPVTVILPELIDGRWWGYLMHTNRERRLRARLLRHAPNVVVSSVPWRLQAVHPEQAIAEEEPPRAIDSAKPAA